MKKSVLYVPLSLILLFSFFFMNNFGVEGSIQNILVEDDFESYAVGTFPSAGGWELWANGAGAASQVIVDHVSVSPTKSMQLLGLDYGPWASYPAILFESDAPEIGYEVNVRVEETRGGSRDNARIAFSSRVSFYITREYAPVFFSDDGSIRSGGKVLQSYAADKWYNVKSIVNRVNETYSVWIDGVLSGEDLTVTTTSGDISTYPSSLIQGFSVSQCYNGVKIYFDDVKVFEMTESTPSGSSLAPSNISIMAEPLSTLAGSPVNVFGTLTDTNGDALQNKTVVLSYIFSGLDSWVPISSDLTDEQGKYAIQWVNSASGTFTLKAEWSGDETNNGTSNQTSLSFLPYQNQQNFIFETNSTIYDLNFNATASSLTFNVTGLSGTTGYVKVTIAKSLVANAEDIKVHLDGKPLNYEVTPNANAWLLTFTYGHSSHRVRIILAASTATMSFMGIVLWIAIVSTPIAVAISVCLLFYFKKRKHLTDTRV
jgi:hypothetical protein